MKILALHLKKFIDYAQLRGISRKELIRSMKNPPTDFNDPHAKADMADYYSLIEFISTELGDNLLGIRVGNYLNLSTLGVIYEISLKATSNEEAIYYCHAYLQKTFPALRIAGSVSGRLMTTKLNIETTQIHANRIILETLLTIMAREIRIISGEQTNIRLFSPYYHPGYPSEWTKGESFALKFNQTILKASLRDNSRWGLDLLIPAYLKMIQHMKPERSFSDKVKIAALNLARPTLPDLDSIAGGFNMTARTFQRRLMTENNTYRQITDELKQEISNLLLRHDRFSVGDISSVLGYSDPAAFIHSFQKWHGKSPLLVRRTMMSGKRPAQVRAMQR